MKAPSRTVEAPWDDDGATGYNTESQQQHCGRVMYLDRFSYNPIELAIFGVVKNKLHKYLVIWYCTYLRTYLPKKNGDG